VAFVARAIVGRTTGATAWWFENNFRGLVPFDIFLFPFSTAFQPREELTLYFLVANLVDELLQHFWVVIVELFACLGHRWFQLFHGDFVLLIVLQKLNNVFLERFGFG
jgi:hypothetical protein